MSDWTDRIAYLNGERVAVPAHDHETETVDICSLCLLTFIVGKHHAMAGACQELRCPMRDSTPVGTD